MPANRHRTIGRRPLYDFRGLFGLCRRFVLGVGHRSEQTSKQNQSYSKNTLMQFHGPDSITV
ncbi:MAG: hypothetical protein CMJ50_03070 [Planctomycetaceae bacterium]|nr:hypothetical protein [Planctomycetaceae bacterium]